MSCLEKNFFSQEFFTKHKSLMRYLPVLVKAIPIYPQCMCLLKPSSHSRLREIVSKCTIFSFYLKFSRAVNLGVKETICKAWLGIAIIDWNVCLSLHSMMKVEHVAYE